MREIGAASLDDLHPHLREPAVPRQKAELLRDVDDEPPVRVELAFFEHGAVGGGGSAPLGHDDGELHHGVVHVSFEAGEVELVGEDHGAVCVARRRGPGLPEDVRGEGEDAGAAAACGDAREPVEEGDVLGL